MLKGLIACFIAMLSGATADEQSLGMVMRVTALPNYDGHAARAWPEARMTMTMKDYTGLVLVPLVMMLYSSPIPVLRDIVHRKSTDKYEFLPYVLLWANCFVWVIFCLHRGVELMYEPFIVNSYGLCINTVTLAVYANYISDSAGRLNFFTKVPPALLGLVLLAMVSCISGSNDCTDPSSLICWWGKVCVIVNCALFAGPFAAFREAWESKSVEFMPLGSSICGLVASLDCSVYFFCLSDINGLIPNACGVVLSAVQICFYKYMVYKFPQLPAVVRQSSLKLGLLPAVASDVNLRRYSKSRPCEDRLHASSPKLLPTADPSGWVGA